MGTAASAVQYLLNGVVPEREETVKSTPSDLAEFHRLTVEHGGILPMQAVAGILNVSHERVRQLVATEKLKSVQFVGKTAVLVDSLKAYIQAGPPLRGRPRLTRAILDGAREILRD